MRLRKQALGTRNLVGTRVEEARKNLGMKQKELLAQLQVNGVDMNASGLSKNINCQHLLSDYSITVTQPYVSGSSPYWMPRSL